jgi:hypothetical protein
MVKYISFIRMFIKKGFSYKEAMHMSEWKMGNLAGKLIQRARDLAIIRAKLTEAYEDTINNTSPSPHVRDYLDGKYKGIELALEALKSQTHER